MIRLTPRTPAAGAAAAEGIVGSTLQVLKDAFGGDVGFHPADGRPAVRGNGNGRPGSVATSSSRRPYPALPSVPPRLVEEVVRDTTTQRVVRNLDDGRILLGIPVMAKERRLGVALAVSSLDENELALQLAEASVALVEARREVDGRNDQLQLFADQLSRTLEEVTWFRTLAGSLDCYSPENSLEEVAATTFPTLREVLQAEAVVLVSGPPRPFTPEAATERLEFAAWVGKPVMDLDRCREFVAGIISGARNHPFVWNFGTTLKESPFKVAQEVRSCILAEVRDGSRQFGWILVLNRVPPPYEIRDGHTGEIATMGCDEFGSVEATLVTSAARLLATHATNVGLFRDQRDFTIGVIRSMINVVDARDRYTSGHSDRVALSARFLADRLGLSLPDQEQIYLAGLLHDVGKVGIPDEVLLKPGKLTPDEFAIIQQHPQRGVDILKHIKQLRPMLPGVLYHHESWDGTGYPHGLAGDSIPLMARVIAVADAFDAMTTCRPYRCARTVENAADVLRHGSGGQWDPRIVPVFLEHLDDIVQRSQDWESHIASILDDVDDLTDDLCGGCEDDAVNFSGAYAVVQT